MSDPYIKDSLGVADPANNIYELPIDVLPVGVKSLRITNDTAGWLPITVVTVVGEEVTLDIPPNTVWIEPLRISEIVAATGLTVHGYTDDPSV